MQMYTFWANVRTVTGGFMRVTVQAATPFHAKEMLLAMYGDKLISEANFV